MSLVDFIALYLYGLVYVVIFIAIFLAFSGIDDLIIDAIYWSRQAWRHLTVYRRHARADQALLATIPEKPLAILIPAWQEHHVIGQMVNHLACTVAYENYHVFIGTYPNDLQTQHDVDLVASHFSNIHKVVCARPGPTSKADCLNNILDAIRQFEHKSGLEFSGFILHDAEDIVSSMELKLFNYLVDRKDLIQVPVYPLPRQWHNLIGMHYLDEFTELHAKDIVVREAIVGQVPSAGVGTCFSKRAIETLLLEGDGTAFDIQSLTEDYDISFRLKKYGLKEVFVRYSISDTPKSTWKRARTFGQTYRDAHVICVREFFPNTLATVIRQKSRWIIGIVFQGFLTHGWTNNWRLNYFLWRDRKGVLTNVFSFAANLVLFQIVALWLYESFWPNAYRFLSIFGQNEWLIVLLWINLFLMSNRIFQRLIFVSQYYGLAHGLLSIPRLLVGNFINFLAVGRAVLKVLQHGHPHQVAWDKTTHDFPETLEIPRARRRIGQILIDRGDISIDQLRLALLHQPMGLRLGSWLVHSERLTPLQLAQGLSEQAQVNFESVDSFAIPQTIVALVPPRLALHHAILPLRLEGQVLWLASESAINPISLAALKRQLHHEIKYVITSIGQVTVGLRYHYTSIRPRDPRVELERAVTTERIDTNERTLIWQYYVSRQIMLGEVLQSIGRVDTAAFASILLQHTTSDLSLGEFFVYKNVISQDTLDKALALQLTLQPSVEMAIVWFENRARTGLIEADHA